MIGKRLINIILLHKQHNSIYKKIFSSKIIKFYDIYNIDYQYIEKLFNKKLPEWEIRSSRHESNKKKEHNTYVYNLDIKTQSQRKYYYNFETKYFYNEEIKQKVFNFFKKDFDLFYQNGIDYINSAI